jgi:hypothetical protein
MSDETLWRITYTIVPDVEIDGTKTYNLFRRFGCASHSSHPDLIAISTDRAVLEDAIRHLEQKP